MHSSKHAPSNHRRTNYSAALAHAIGLLANQIAIGKIITSDCGDDQHWDFVLRQLADPGNERPINYLTAKGIVDRSKVYNQETKQFENRAIDEIKNPRGRPKATRFTKKSSVTLLPPDGRMIFFHCDAKKACGVKNTVGLLFDLSQCDRLKRKYIFDYDSATKDRWHLYHPDAEIRESSSLGRIQRYHQRMIQERSATNASIPLYNEMSARLAAESVSAVFATQNDLTSRLNALHKKFVTIAYLESLGIVNENLPILIMSAVENVQEYTLAQQLADIEAALRLPSGHPAHRFVRAIPFHKITYLRVHLLLNPFVVSELNLPAIVAIPDAIKSLEQKNYKFATRIFRAVNCLDIADRKQIEKVVSEHKMDIRDVISIFGELLIPLWGTKLSKMINQYPAEVETQIVKTSSYYAGSYELGLVFLQLCIFEKEQLALWLLNNFQNVFRDTRRLENGPYMHHLVSAAKPSTDLIAKVCDYEFALLKIKRVDLSNSMLFQKNAKGEKPIEILVKRKNYEVLGYLMNSPMGNLLGKDDLFHWAVQDATPNLKFITTLCKQGINNSTLVKIDQAICTLARTERDSLELLRYFNASPTGVSDAANILKHVLDEAKTTADVLETVKTVESRNTLDFICKAKDSSQCVWRGAPTSEKWAELMEHARKRVLQLVKSQPLLKEDHDVKAFLNISTRQTIRFLSRTLIPLVPDEAKEYETLCLKATSSSAVGAAAAAALRAASHAAGAKDEPGSELQLLPRR